MLIVISNPIPILNEATFINGLFNEGMEIFHLRKPEATADELRMLLEKIAPSHRSKVALHQHYSVAKEFGLKRLHFTEIKRKEMSEEQLLEQKKQNHILSTSIHQTEEYKSLPSCFSYTFFGPVFNSISKEGYNSALTNEFEFSVENNHPQVIALGGISETNVNQALKMKFDGVAVLGTIWQQPGESIQKFKAIQQAWKQAGQ